MDFNLDQEIPRTGTGSAKWGASFEDGEFVQTDRSDPKYGDDQLLPLWVADMDFRCPPAVVEALQERAAHGLFGYTMITDSYYESVISWAKRRYQWEIEKEWIEVLPGVVPAINIIVQTFTEPNDKIMIQRPVYFPFTAAIENNGRQVVSNSLIYDRENGYYTIDFEDFAAKAADPAVKMFILCSPHNPVGRVWTKEELTKMGEICLEHDVMVIADEIHCDLIFDGITFTSFGSISEAFVQNSIICIAPSKTFNLAGLKTSNILFANKEMRDVFNKAMECLWIKGANSFGIVAAEAGYRHGEEWLAAVMEYVQENYNFMADYLAKHIPQIKPIQPEGTYLAWLDCTDLGLECDERYDMIMNEANVFLTQGKKFGPEGEMFERVNLACPRSILTKALERIKEIVYSRTAVPAD